MEAYLWVFNFVSREINICTLSKYFSLDRPSTTSTSSISVSLIDGRSDIYDVRVSQSSNGKLHLLGGQAINSGESLKRSVKRSRSAVAPDGNGTDSNTSTTVVFQGVYYISLTTLPSLHLLASHLPELYEFRFMKPVMVRTMRTLIADHFDYYPLRIRHANCDFVPITDQQLEQSGQRRCALNFANANDANRRLYIYKNFDARQAGFVFKTQSLCQSTPADLHLLQQLQVNPHSIDSYFWPKLLMFGRHPFDKNTLWWLMPFRGISVLDVLSEGSIKSDDLESWSSYALQVAMALHLLHCEFSTTHSDHHQGNVLIHKHASPITIELQTPIIKIHHTTSISVTFIDFGKDAARSALARDPADKRPLTIWQLENYNNTSLWFKPLKDFLARTPLAKLFSNKSALSAHEIFSLLNKSPGSTDKTQITLLELNRRGVNRSSTLSVTGGDVSWSNDDEISDVQDVDQADDPSSSSLPPSSSSPPSSESSTGNRKRKKVHSKPTKNISAQALSTSPPESSATNRKRRKADLKLTENVSAQATSASPLESSFTNSKRGGTSKKAWTRQDVIRVKSQLLKRRAKKKAKGH